MGHGWISDQSVAFVVVVIIGSMCLGSVDCDYEYINVFLVPLLELSGCHKPCPDTYLMATLRCYRLLNVHIGCYYCATDVI